MVSPFGNGSFKAKPSLLVPVADTFAQLSLAEGAVTVTNAVQLPEFVLTEMSVVEAITGAVLSLIVTVFDVSSVHPLFVILRLTVNERSQSAAAMTVTLLPLFGPDMEASPETVHS